MKKQIILLTLFTLLFSFRAFASPSPVTDYADLLTAQEESILRETLSDIRRIYGMDVSLYTETAVPQESALERAEHLYDTLGYGSGESRDGILLYLSLDDRSYAFATTGYGISVFDDAVLSAMESAMLTSLQNGDYFRAFSAYAEEADRALYDWKYYDYPSEETVTYSLSDALPFIIGALILLPLILAFIMTLIKLSHMKTAKSDNFAANYIKAGSFQLTDSRDIFLYSSIRKIPKPQPQNHSGARRSSGPPRGHGGRSGRF